VDLTLLFSRLQILSSYVILPPRRAAFFRARMISRQAGLPPPPPSFSHGGLPSSFPLMNSFSIFVGDPRSRSRYRCCCWISPLSLPRTPTHPVFQRIFSLALFSSWIFLGMQETVSLPAGQQSPPRRPPPPDRRRGLSLLLGPVYYAQSLQQRTIRPCQLPCRSRALRGLFSATRRSSAESGFSFRTLLPPRGISEEDPFIRKPFSRTSPRPPHEHPPPPLLKN